MRKKYFWGLIILMAFFSVSCEKKSPNLITNNTTESPSTVENANENLSTVEPIIKPSPLPSLAPTRDPNVGTRDNTPLCLVPTADGTIVYTSTVSTLDVSNASEGYVIANYFGSSGKVKFRITGEDKIIYTYDLHGGSEVFPLSSGSGSYDLAIFENVLEDQYSTAQFETISVSLNNKFGPFLYPNQYVYFDSSSVCVEKAKTLSESSNNDLDVVSSIYNYIIENITYDYDKASSVKSGYLPNPDDLLVSKSGICLDYASLMVAMLRSQRIPARLEVGYVGDAYHAWISAYIQEVGWVNGIIEFDGNNWKLMDPTFAASTPGEDLENFIGDGSSYLTKYIY